MAKKMIECVLAVGGECTEVNSFDAAFRSGTPPRWSDRPEEAGTGYTLNALVPVPPEVERRGYATAGHLWCSEHWGPSDDLTRLSVRRGFKERVYRFFTPENAPRDVLGYASLRWPRATFLLAYIEKDKTLLNLGTCLCILKYETDRAWALPHHGTGALLSPCETWGSSCRPRYPRRRRQRRTDGCAPYHPGRRLYQGYAGSAGPAQGARLWTGHLHRAEHNGKAGDRP